jgi:hypothetical protein
MAQALKQSEPFFRSFAVGFTPNYGNVHWKGRSVSALCLMCGRHVNTAVVIVAPNGTCGLCAYERAHPGPADQQSGTHSYFNDSSVISSASQTLIPFALVMV